MKIPKNKYLIVSHGDSDWSFTESEIILTVREENITLIDDSTLRNFVKIFTGRWQGYECSNYDSYVIGCITGKITDSESAQKDAMMKWINESFLPVYITYYEYYSQRLRIYNAMYPDLADVDVGAKIKELIKTESVTGLKNINSDLPNKQINEDDYFSYPTNTSKQDSTAETTDSTMLLGMYRSYLGGLRNILLEFAEKFSDCFMHTFSGGEMES